MSPNRKTAFSAGLWFIATFAFSIPAGLLYDPVLNDPDYILGTGADTRIQLGAFFEVLLAIANIATAVVLFRVLRRVNEAVALGYVALRIMESAIIVTGLISLMTVVTMREEFIEAAAGGAPNLTAQTLVEFHVWTRILGPQFCAGFGNGILLGYLLYKSALVPPRMALLGLIGGPLAFIGGTAVLLGLLDARDPLLFLFTAVEFVWEASLAFYLTFKGFRPSPILTDDAHPVAQTA